LTVELEDGNRLEHQTRMVKVCKQQLILIIIVSCSVQLRCCCRYDAVVLATHSDISLSLLGAGATEEERTVLKAIPYNNNDIYLHTDEALMPVSESPERMALFGMHVGQSASQQTVCGQTPARPERVSACGTAKRL
jgi:hypothetical protein